MYLPVERWQQFERRDQQMANRSEPIGTLTS